MAGQIRLTPETMRQRSGEVRTEGQNFEQVISKMQSVINELETEWEGEASRRFAEQFNTLRPSFNEMRELIEDISMQLSGTADAIEQLDSDIASKFVI